jgi:acyl carrier protein
MAPWVDELNAVPPDRRALELSRLLRSEVADTLGFDGPANVPVDRSFYELGMDSLMMADLVSRLKKRVGFSCTALVFDRPTVQGLAEGLAPRMPSSGSAATEPSPPAQEIARAGAGQDAGGSSPTAGPMVGYDPALEPDVFAFQQTAWPNRNAALIPSRWRWMFVESARRLGLSPQAWLYRDAGRIVGHMGSIPVRLKIGDEERPTGWLVDTMVLKEFRSQAVGSRLMVEAHDDQPFSLSLGQTAEMREIQLRLGWKQVAPLQVAQLLLRPENVLRGKAPAPAVWAASLGLRASHAVRDLLGDRRRLSVTTLDRFDDRHDRLWQEVSRDVTCAVVRDQSYLNWKYVDQPGQEFLRLEVRDGDAIVGVAIWTFRDADQHYRYRRAFLVDLVAPMGQHAVVTQIIQAACGALSHKHVDAALCHHIDRRLTEALRAAGFQMRTPERFLLVDPGSLSGADRERVLSADNWFVTQGDSDIDRP